MIENHWKKIKGELEETLPEHTFNTWIKPLELRSHSQNNISIGVPNIFYQQKVKTLYAQTIKEKFEAFIDNPNIVFVSMPKKNTLSQALISEISEQKTLEKEKSKRLLTQLNERYVFDAVIVGAHNEMAVNAAKAVCEKPGKLYNPLFLFGGVGLGKTHLMGAIGNQILQSSPNKKVLYRTTEQFTNELISSIRYQKTGEFRNQYRLMCDVLLIDDVQFLSGKERTQEEFFHTFNALMEQGVQVVLTSDQLPRNIPALDARLRSRFESGLFCDIGSPDIETRVAILRKKAVFYKIDLDDDVAFFLAHNFKSNVRSLEGALIRLSAYSSLSKVPVGLALVKQIFSNFGLESEPKQSVLTIQKKVAAYFKMTLADLSSPKRHKTIVFPRQIAMYLCRKLTRHSYPEIGHHFGGKDHTTVLHACEKIERKLEKDIEFKSVLRTLESDILS